MYLHNSQDLNARSIIVWTTRNYAQWCFSVPTESQPTGSLYEQYKSMATEQLHLTISSLKAWTVVNSSLAYLGSQELEPIAQLSSSLYSTLLAVF